MDETRVIRREIEDMQRHIDEVRQSGQCTGSVEKHIQTIEAAAQEIMRLCEAFEKLME